MGTNLRPELSEKNRYWLPKHRFYELQHFCLQYPEWEKMYKTLDEAPLHSSMCKSIPVQSGFSDPTSRFAEVRIYYWERIEMVRRTARRAAEDLDSYLLKAVTEGLSYEVLNVQSRIPCCKSVWYTLYRRFFWLLDKERR